MEGGRLSRILAGDPLAGWKKKRDKLFVLSVRNALSVVYRTHVSKLWTWPIVVFKMVEDPDKQKK